MKKFLALGLAVTMAMTTLAGCGAKSDNKPSAESNGTAVGNGSEATGKFVIGGLGPLTGGAASYGISVKQGAEIAISEINKAGGVKVGDTTYELVLNFKDDEAKEDTAITAYNALMDQGMDALLGGVTSGACIAVKDLSYKDNILQITPSGSAIACAAAPNVFRLCFTDPLQGVTLADYVADDMKLTKVAVIYNNSDEYSTGILEAFLEQAKEKNLEVVASEAFNEGDVDFTTQLTKIKGTDAEVIVVPAYYEAAAYIMQQAAANGMSLPFLGSDGWDGVIAQLTDATVAEGAIFLSPFLASDPGVQTFVTSYEAAYKTTPDQFAADGYDTVYVMKAALEKAGSTETDALIAAMTQIQVNGMTGTVTFTEDGEPNKGAKFVTIKEGNYAAK